MRRGIALFTSHDQLIGMRPMTSPLLLTPARRTLLALCGGAAVFPWASASYGQAQQVPIAEGSVSGTGQQAVAPIDPQSLSCNDLKAQLKGAGELRILSGPKGGWGDTFYGPAVPRCQFWQMPLFAYVRARDGLCGIGYICIDKYSMD